MLPHTLPALSRDGLHPIGFVGSGWTAPTDRASSAASTILPTAPLPASYHAYPYSKPTRPISSTPHDTSIGFAPGVLPSASSPSYPSRSLVSSEYSDTSAYMPGMATDKSQLSAHSGLTNGPSESDKHSIGFRHLAQPCAAAGHPSRPAKAPLARLSDDLSGLQTSPLSSAEARRGFGFHDHSTNESTSRAQDVTAYSDASSLTRLDGQQVSKRSTAAASLACTEDCVMVPAELAASSKGEFLVSKFFLVSANLHSITGNSAIGLDRIA
ncbi:unnamed protein product [Protopolystoma xenopodis]|uniref:Uncharacterized protein n=1 Tax=Protopolystoma xenopodis TaxID=117903 RepID=A0A3S5A9I3_9PLAT|nr:unnamed protein product [Protopolystoma xenopodis]